MKFRPQVPASRIYVLRSDEGEGVWGHDRDMLSPHKDRPSTFILDQLRSDFNIPKPEPVRPPKVRRVRPRRLYVPVDEYGSAERWAIHDKTTGHILARVWGSHFHAWKEAIAMAKSQGATDRDVYVKRCQA